MKRDMNKMKEKILFVTRKYPPSTGGMENYCFELTNSLIKKGHEVKIVALGKSQNHLVWFFPYALLYVLLNAQKYDYLIIGDALMSFVGNVAKLKSKKIKRVCIVHGLDITFSNYLYQLYLKMFFRKSAEIYVPNSRATQNVLLDRWQVKTKIITPGVDVNKFKDCSKNQAVFRKKYNIPQEDIILLTTGRLVKRKGVAWFVRNVMPNVRDCTTYLVIGQGEEYDTICDAIKDTQLQNKVKLLGRVSDEELNAAYVNCDVFVMPNFHVDNNMEGFGMVAVEASIAGAIVVASGIEGIRDAIVEGENGFLLTSLDAEAYQNKIIEIYNNKAKYEKFGQLFQEYTKENYSWECICKQYCELLQEI